LFVSEECQVIVCVTRTSGMTVEAMNRLEGEYNLGSTRLRNHNHRSGRLEARNGSQNSGKDVDQLGVVVFTRPDCCEHTEVNRRDVGGICGRWDKHGKGEPR